MLQHTRKSLVEATETVRRETDSAALTEMLEEIAEEAVTEIDPPIVFTPAQTLRSGARDARALARWAHEEGAYSAVADVRPFRGRAVVVLRVPAEEVAALMDST